MAPGGLSWTTAGKAPSHKTPLHVFQTAANGVGLFQRDGTGAPLPTGPGVYFPDTHGRVPGRTLQANQFAQKRSTVQTNAWSSHRSDLAVPHNASSRSLTFNHTQPSELADASLVNTVGSARLLTHDTDADASPPPPLPDMLMMGEVNDFDDWFAGFKAHATSKTFDMNGETYTVSMTRGEALDESKTDVFCEFGAKNKFAATFASMDMAKFGPVMQEEAFVKMSAKAIKSQEAPLVLGPMPADPAAKGVNMFVSYEVADADKWKEGFLAHANSHTGNGLWETPSKYMRSEMCDDSKTRIFQSAYNPKRVAILCYDMDLGKMGEFMGDAAFAEISAVLKIDPATMTMNTVMPLP